MLQIGKHYYCSTDSDVDLIMRLFEKNHFKWASGRELRSQYQESPIIYKIDEPTRIRCENNPLQDNIDIAINVINVRNKIISELRR